MELAATHKYSHKVPARVVTAGNIKGPHMRFLGGGAQRWGFIKEKHLLEGGEGGGWPIENSDFLMNYRFALAVFVVAVYCS